MEKGAKTSSGYSISDKKPSSLLLSNSEGVSLMKLHSTESFPPKISMMGFQHQESNLDRPSSGGGGGGGGNSGGANDVGGESFTRSCSNPQPFDILAPNPSTPYKSPGGNMAASVGFPFTFAQWKELETQAMIYKYMVSSVPVPSDLLFPLSRNYPAAAIDSSSLYNVRYSKNGDPEPGRCKRTDGKKWRCSRDVAPHQKYCERHLHRGRPRSRKPVEVKKNDENHKKPKFEKSPLPNSTSSQQFVAANDQPLLLSNAKNNISISTAPSNKATDRDLSLMMEGDPTVEAERQWHGLMEANMGFTNAGSSIYNSSALFHQDYAEQHLLNLSSLEGQNGNFTDAWSINNLTNNANLKNLCPSLNLSIAMATGYECKDSRFLSSLSWEPFAQGGPLAEAFQPGSGVVGCSKPASPNHSISPPATAVSSPSGVLHRTLFSHSDSSVCNSPNFVGPASDFVFNRLN